MGSESADMEEAFLKAIELISTMYYDNKSLQQHKLELAEEVQREIAQRESAEADVADTFETLKGVQADLVKMERKYRREHNKAVSLEVQLKQSKKK